MMPLSALRGIVDREPMTPASQPVPVDQIKFFQIEPPRDKPRVRLVFNAFCLRSQREQSKKTNSRTALLNSSGSLREGCDLALEHRDSTHSGWWWGQQCKHAWYGGGRRARRLGCKKRECPWKSRKVELAMGKPRTSPCLPT